MIMKIKKYKILFLNNHVYILFNNDLFEKFYKPKFEQLIYHRSHEFTYIRLAQKKLPFLTVKLIEEAFLCIEKQVFNNEN
jgi:hypothetical protein